MVKSASSHSSFQPHPTQALPPSFRTYVLPLLLWGASLIDPLLQWNINPGIMKVRRFDGTCLLQWIISLDRTDKNGFEV